MSCSFERYHQNYSKAKSFGLTLSSLHCWSSKSSLILPTLVINSGDSLTKQLQFQYQHLWLKLTAHIHCTVRKKKRNYKNQTTQISVLNFTRLDKVTILFYPLKAKFCNNQISFILLLSTNRGTAEIQSWTCIVFLHIFDYIICFSVMFQYWPKFNIEN